ncbi:MAG: type 4a pilus biogenesis protein PilO [Deltaproteobacteria bacterium]|nr:type 4a pilus biogenesis protein PilO [Deltaproteobacteria bacterium]
MSVNLQLSLSEREKWMALVVAIAVIYFVFDYWIYMPQTQQLKELKKQIETTSTETQGLLSNIRDPRSLVAEVEVLQKKLVFLEEKIPLDGRTGPFLEQIARTCQQLQMEIITMKPQETDTDAADFKRVAVQIRLKSNFKTINRFMQEIKKLPVLTIVDELEIRKGRSTDKLDFYLVLATFFPSM